MHAETGFMNSLRVLVVATKSPCPAVGGGNVALNALLRALPDQGVAVRVVAPGRSAIGTDPPPYPLRAVAAKARPWLSLVANLAVGLPIGIARYHLPALGRAVEEEVAGFDPHLVHVEQAQLVWLIRRLACRCPILLRQQNVESQILERLAQLHRWPLRGMLKREARRTAAVEAEACRAARVVAAISSLDAVALLGLAPAARVFVLPAPFETDGPFALTPLAGDPPWLCLGSFDWRPNRDGATWLLGQVWPHLRELSTGGVLHLVGPGSTSLPESSDPRVVRHGRVQSAAAMYHPRAVALVPVRAGSGVRLRIIEAWAAGVPVVTTPVGAEGLGAIDGDDVLVAESPSGFAAAAVRAAGEPALRQRLVSAGQRRLASHKPDAVATRAVSLYRAALASDSSPAPALC